MLVNIEFESLINSKDPDLEGLLITDLLDPELFFIDIHEPSQGKILEQ